MRTTIAATLLAALALAPAIAEATAQRADKLDYKGETHKLYSTPLEEYWTDANPRPAAHLPWVSTACWRGYVGLWAIRDGFLELTGLEPCRNKDPKLPLDKILPGRTLPLRATWFTGVLRLPQGKMLGYVHMGFQSRYERDLLLTIDHGKLVREVLVDNVEAGKSGAQRKPEDLDAGLAPLRNDLRACFGARKPPEALELRLLITADGQPSVVEIENVDRRISSCLEARIIVVAKFPVAESQTDQLHRFVLDPKPGPQKP